MKKKDVFGDMGKKRMGMKGLELKGGFSFVKKSGGKKTAHKGNSKKIWHW